MILKKSIIVWTYMNESLSESISVTETV